MANGRVNPAGNPAAAVSFKFWFFGHIFDLIRLNGRALLVCATVGYCFYEISTALRAFVGQTTFASITLRILANIVLQWSATITISGLSLALYIREKHQHEKTRERLTERITKLEVGYDPNRTSSDLTTRGRTKKEDE